MIYYWVYGDAKTFCSPYESEAGWYAKRYGFRKRYREEMEPFNLYNGRHPLPLNTKAIFGSDTEPLDFDALDLQAWGALKDIRKPIVVYVTGLTTAVAEVIWAAARLKQDITFMHYDKNIGKYFPRRYDFARTEPF